MNRTVAAGATAALVYVAVVAVTGLVSDRDVRPLFDATGPPPPYRWVKPPPDFAAGNVRPKPVEVTISLKPEDPPPAGASEDNQFVFSLPRDAMAPGPAGEVQAVARIEAVDPDTLAALPAGTFADGNAYRITFGYGAADQPATLTRPGSILLTVPVPADSVLYSEDGRVWRGVTSQHASANAVGAEMPGPGYFVATTPDVIGYSDSGGGFGRLLLPIVITVVIAGALVARPVLMRRRRPPAGRPPAARRQGR